jgi:membrane protein implicated in regulation of membrane protease activity
MAIFTWQTWLVITLVCGMVELFWFNTYTLCLSIAAFLTMLATIFGLVSGAWQAIAFVVLAGLLVLADEKLFKPYLAQMKNKNENQPQQSEEPKQN